MLASALIPLLLSVLAGMTASGTVEIRRDLDIIRVFIDDAPFAVYQTAEERPKPSFVEIRAANGALLTRPLSSAGGKDAHHHGLWIAVDNLNGADFWHEKGCIENVSVRLLGAKRGPAVMETTNHWLDEDSNLVIRETTQVKFFAHRLMTFDISLTNGERPVTFGDTEEGFLAIRLAHSMCEEQTGRVVNADRIETAESCWGRTSAWVDYSGEVDGKTFGAAIFDHPDNFRPSRYHVRGYGLFTINPFGERAYTKGREPEQPVVLPPRSKLRLRYAIYIHRGDAEAGRVAREYEAYVHRMQ